MVGLHSRSSKRSKDVDTTARVSGYVVGPVDQKCQLLLTAARVPSPSDDEPWQISSARRCLCLRPVGMPSCLIQQDHGIAHAVALIPEESYALH